MLVCMHVCMYDVHVQLLRVWLTDPSRGDIKACGSIVIGGWCTMMHALECFSQAWLLLASLCEYGNGKFRVHMSIQGK